MSIPNMENYLVPADIPSSKEARENLQKEIYLSLGGGMIDIELDPEHYHLAINRALDRYRTRSTNALQEAFIFLELQPDVNEYVLPKEVMIVKNVYRRGSTGNTPGGTFFDPFTAGIINSIYAIPYASGTSGDLITYDFAWQYQELVGRLFGRELIFHFDRVTKKLTFHRHFVTVETVLLWVYMMKPENVLLSDPSSRIWIRDYAIAQAKYMLGEARSYISGIPSPGGSVTLNGESLKNEAIAEMQRLEEELMRYKDGPSEGYGFVIG